MSQQYILKISELTKKVKYLLESEMNTVWLTGEISNFVAAASGHWYLSLKDSKAQVRCAMFKGNNNKVRIKPSNGQQVLVRARVSLYEPRGDFQLIIDQMDDAGDGLLQQQFEKLKKTLNAQGYFSTQNKQALPEHINTLGVVTSPTGAAIKDILSVLQRRSPQTHVIIYPALVQGKDAKRDIAAAIEQANIRRECDVLIVGRGGGSLEDLWSFNEEIVVEAIFQSKIPIISAVGHEIDTTLADYVADIRAATPSAAAELASKNTADTLDKALQLKQRLIRQLSIITEKWQQQLTNITHRLDRVHPEQQIVTQQQRADELANRLTTAQLNRLARLSLPSKLVNQRFAQLPIQQNITRQQQHSESLQTRLIEAINFSHQRKQQKFVKCIEQLQLVSPLATIARGYSVTRTTMGIVKSVKQVDIGKSVEVQLSDGKFAATVTSVNDS
ncbi:exodeoxyribonuclease VII large subunit [Thalassotalea sp. 1_MG-2023]|uniref:exodeoxyribonuclease VII large subunit n=1 Tax=Thalassotalea sp. 1_MG-2023 TaxID=3062680 RepID=UPI0026E49482|nr:exodeoxyribonuclease VII large subunit [Thalassotalea sp. 1_MG-2023]MDO6427444.1 exodeoxyribonuclease VII large subunit [Thalassotalea sp. 1_MG-2023]